MGKKGVALESLAPIAMTLVFVGVALGLGSYINQQVKITGFGTVVGNESTTFVNNTYKGLQYQAESVTALTNSTDTLPAALWTSRISGADTQVRIQTNATYNAVVWNVSYVAFNEQGALALANASVGMGTLSNWLPIIAVILAAAVVIGVLIMYFGRGKF